MPKGKPSESFRLLHKGLAVSANEQELVCCDFTQMHSLLPSGIKPHECYNYNNKFDI